MRFEVGPVRMQPFDDLITSIGGVREQEMSPRQEFADFVAARQEALVRAAWLLTGDRHSAEDLVQIALLSAWRRWPRIHGEDPTAYVSRSMYTAYVSSRRRRWISESTLASVPDQSDSESESQRVLERHELVAELRRLPPRQRAVIVLRYYEDKTETETAEILGCSLGTVKSQAHRALSKLKAAWSENTERNGMRYG